MEKSQLKRNQIRAKRVMRIRKHLRGSAEKPRLCVSKTNKNLSVQLIDDDKGVTLVSSGGKKSKEAARQIGTTLAQRAQEKQIKTVVFDRGRFKFHGIIAELATAAREAGLQF